VLLNSVDRWRKTTQFLQKWCNFICLRAWASEGFYPDGALVDFSNSFIGGAKSGEIRFLPQETKKIFFQSFFQIYKYFFQILQIFSKFSNFCHIPTPMFACRKSWFHTIKNLV